MPENVTEEQWLINSREAYRSSTGFFDNNYRKPIEDNIRHFHSKHHNGSKYNKAAYQYRSKIFRPKTRSSIRANEAAGAAVFFGNADLVSIEARNPNDQVQMASADVTKELVNFRLNNTIPWYMTIVGGIQDAQVVGVVCSKQYWDYEAKDVTYKVKLQDPETGEEIEGEQTETVITKDEPAVDIIPVENFRFHPAADWRDPVNTSPYFIHIIPMFVGDIKKRMEKEDPKTGQPKWKKLTDGELLTATKWKFDSTRMEREKGATDKTDPDMTGKLSDFDIAWVLEYFMKIDGEDYVYYTLTDNYVLTEPRPIGEVYFHGIRPFVVGYSVIETHRTMPTSVAGLGAPLQKEMNENVNQRSDNVKFVMNKRWFVKRGKQVDVRSIVANVPGSVTLMNDPEGDVKGQEFGDVTSSAYAEQDRLNLDFDDLVGTFANSTIQGNRKMNETVGGMKIAKGNTNAMTEYLLMTISETWVEKVIKQLILLEHAYETDEVLLGIAYEKAEIWKKYQIPGVTDAMLQQDLKASVNVGFGMTDPMVKLEKFLMGVNAVAQISQAPPPGMKTRAVNDEIFGKIGYKDSSRFFETGDQAEQTQAHVQQLEAALQELQKQLADQEADRKVKLLIAQTKEAGDMERNDDDNETDILMKEMDRQSDREAIAAQFKLKRMDIAGNAKNALSQGAQA